MTSQIYWVNARKLREGENDADQIETIPFLMAKWTSSALPCSLSVFMSWYLWNSTVRGEMSSFEAISLVDLPSATSCRISRWRGVKAATGSVGCDGDFSCRERRHPQALA